MIHSIPRGLSRRQFLITIPRLASFSKCAGSISEKSRATAEPRGSCQHSDFVRFYELVEVRTVNQITAPDPNVRDLPLSHHGPQSPHMRRKIFRSILEIKQTGTVRGKVHLLNRRSGFLEAFLQ